MALPCAELASYRVMLAAYAGRRPQPPSTAKPAATAALPPVNTERLVGCLIGKPSIECRQGGYIGSMEITIHLVIIGGREWSSGHAIAGYQGAISLRRPTTGSEFCCGGASGINVTASGFLISPLSRKRASTDVTSKLTARASVGVAAEMS